MLASVSPFIVLNLQTCINTYRYPQFDQLNDRGTPTFYEGKYQQPNPDGTNRFSQTSQFPVLQGRVHLKTSLPFLDVFPPENG